MEQKHIENQSGFTTEEVDFLRNRRLFSVIASKIPSTRARRAGATVAPQFVASVLAGRVTTASDTTEAIKQQARIMLNTLQKV